MDPSPPPEFDAAAEAARFCIAAGDAARERHYALNLVRGALMAVDEVGAAACDGPAIARLWAQYVAVGGDLVELYGLDS